jgi:di/tricarboxylate transporter
MEAGKVIKAPPFLMTAFIAYFSGLCGSLTNYSTGPSVMYFAMGFWSQRSWLCIGLAVSFLYIRVYLSVGMVSFFMFLSRDMCFFWLIDFFSI